MSSPHLPLPAPTYASAGERAMLRTLLRSSSHERAARSPSNTAQNTRPAAARVSDCCGDNTSTLLGAECPIHFQPPSTQFAIDLKQPHRDDVRRKLRDLPSPIAPPRRFHHLDDGGSQLLRIPRDNPRVPHSLDPRRDIAHIHAHNRQVRRERLRLPLGDPSYRWSPADNRRRSSTPAPSPARSIRPEPPIANPPPPRAPP